MSDRREFRVFIASPGDVQTQRRLVAGIVTNLNGAFPLDAAFRSVMWEEEFYRADQTFQSQIPRPAACDVVIVIFKDKLGVKLPDDFPERLDNGLPYPSGTAYELLSAVSAARNDQAARDRAGEDRAVRPAVYVFRSRAEPAGNDAKAERARLNAFFEAHFRTPDGSYTGAYQWYQDADDFEGRVTRLLRDWAARTLRMRVTWDIKEDGSPFRALLPFDARHSRVFFGRDRKVQRARDTLTGARFVRGGLPVLFVVGPSGAGKSSLVRAGVIPLLRQSGIVAPDGLPEEASVDRCRIAVMRPGGGETPFAALARALLETGTRTDANGRTVADEGGFGPALPALAMAGFPVDVLADALAREPAQEGALAALIEALAAVSDAASAAAGLRRAMRVDLVLLVDQLEEIFAVPDHVRQAFAALLLRLAQCGRVWIIATLRADLYDRVLDPTTKLLELKDKGGTYDLASPGIAEVEEILEKSAQAAGMAYETDAHGVPLNRVLEREARGKDSLPLLQYSLDLLFQNLTRAATPPTIETAEGPRLLLTYAAYDAIGRLKGAINRVGEEAFASVSARSGEAEAQAALRHMLRRLAVPLSADAAWTTRAESLDRAGSDRGGRRLIDALVDRRLLMVGEDADAKLRLAHDQVLTAWTRAADMLAEDRTFIRVRQDVEAQNKVWRDNNQPKAALLRGLPLSSAIDMARSFADDLAPELHDFIGRSARLDRRRRGLAASAATVFGVVAVVAVGLGLVALSAEQRATRNYAAAKQAADTLATSMPQALRQQKNIPSDALDVVFGLTDDLITKMRDTAARTDGAATRRATAAFDAVEHLFASSTVPPLDDGSALSMTLAAMQYEEAVTYHSTQKDDARALDKARASLAERSALYEHGHATPQMLADIARTHMEIGDLLRRGVETRLKAMTKGAKPPELPFEEARGAYSRAEQALEALQSAHGPGIGPQDVTLWAREYEKALTKLGDLDRLDGELETATAHYDRARKVTLAQFRQLGDGADHQDAYLEGLHQLAWTRRKLGTVAEDRHDYASAVRAYRDEVCLHRTLLRFAPNNALWSDDLPYNLVVLALALQRLPATDDASAHDALFESLVLRHARALNNSSDASLFKNVADSLDKIGDLLAQGDPARAAIYKTAAKEVWEGIPKAGLVTATGTPEATPLDKEAQSRLRERGGLAMIAPDRALVVEPEMVRFDRERRPAIEADAAGCWNELNPRLLREADEAAG